MIPARSAPPRLVLRTTVATFGVVALVLTAVLLMIAAAGSRYVRASVVEKLAAGQRMLSALEARQAEELRAQAAMLAENPTLKAALDTYAVETSMGGVERRPELVATIQRELEKLAERLHPHVLTVADSEGTVLASAGDGHPQPPPLAHTALRRARPGADGGSVYRRAEASIAIQDVELGTLELAAPLDQAHAEKLALLSGAHTLIVAGNRVVASTLPPAAASAVTPAALRALPGSGTLAMGGDEYAVQLLFEPGGAAVYALESIDDSAGPVLTEAMGSMLWLALAGFSLAGIASLWTAQTLSRPINRLSRSLAEMTRNRTFEHELPATGSSLEVDELTRTFNSMMRSVAAAEAETTRAYVGAIRALALALDARDPYTAGHSERVSAMSVTIGRQLGLGTEDLETLRLGALLHDVGKIGISDDVLRKPEPLTPEEYERIKEHPSLGARILRSVPFLAPHLAIVELHHERPDGRGYPYGLTSDQTPLLARIVHVADAFDAMTSARAYRPARTPGEAVRELWRHAGTEFDAEVVHALVHALPAVSALAAPESGSYQAAAPRTLALVSRS